MWMSRMCWGRWEAQLPRQRNKREVGMVVVGEGDKRDTGEEKREPKTKTKMKREPVNEWVFSEKNENKKRVYLV